MARRKGSPGGRGWRALLALVTGEGTHSLSQALGGGTAPHPTANSSRSSRAHSQVRRRVKAAHPRAVLAVTAQKGDRLARQ